MTESATVNLQSCTEPQKASLLTTQMGNASQSRTAKHLTQAQVDVTHVLIGTKRCRAIGD